MSRLTALDARLDAIIDQMDATQGGPKCILTRADSITPEPITWIWDGWLAAGKLHILAGAPGTGKTTLALAMAATVTCGGRWPDGSRAISGDVVMWSGEDDPTDTLVPRLMAMGAERRRVHFVSGMADAQGRRPFDPAKDIPALAQVMQSIDVRLLIVDPIVSAVAGDSHHNAETRRGLQPLVDLAGARNCALVGITHLSKGTAGRDPVERVTGSLAFGALARVVMLAAQQQGEDGRVLCRAKSNIGPDTGGYGYELRQDRVPGYANLSASSVVWREAVQGTARELVGQTEEAGDDQGTDAANFLHDFLRYGSRPAKDIYRDAEAAGFSRDAMKRAKRRIGAHAVKQGMSGGWVWRLSDAEGSAEGGEERAFQNGSPSLPSDRNTLPSGTDDLTEQVSPEPGEVVL